MSINVGFAVVKINVESRVSPFGRIAALAGVASIALGAALAFII